MVTPKKDAAAAGSAADKTPRKKAEPTKAVQPRKHAQVETERPADSPDIQSVSNPGHRPEPEDMTHEVLRTVVIDSAERKPGDAVHLEGLSAAELESHGYVRRL